MAEHEHSFRHDHEGGEALHNHDERVPGEPAEQDDAGSPSDAVAEHAIDAVAAVAEHAMDSLVEAHREEEETERVEAQAEAVASVVGALAEAAEESAEEGPPVGEEDEGDDEQGHDGEEEGGHAGEDTAAADVTPVVPPQPEEPEAAGVGAERRRAVSRFRGHRGRRVR